MMRIRPISTSITIAMMAIVLAAPLAVNAFLSARHNSPEHVHVAAPQPAQVQHVESESAPPAPGDYGFFR